VTELFIVARFFARPGRDGEVAEALRRVAGPSRAESGCLEYRLLRAQREPGLFFVYSRWSDEAAFERHAAYPHTVTFLERVEPLLRHPLDIQRTSLFE
jgi:quinol monooxygenase YgiN